MKHCYARIDADAYDTTVEALGRHGVLVTRVSDMTEGQWVCRLDHADLPDRVEGRLVEIAFRASSIDNDFVLVLRPVDAGSASMPIPET